MRLFFACVALAGLAVLASCTKKQPTETTNPTAARAAVQLKDGSRIPGTIVESTPEELVVAGDDGIERKIPVSLVKSVEYAEAPAPAGPVADKAVREVTSKTLELLPGSMVSVRTNETIDSAKTSEGRTYTAVVTRDAKDANGDVVIPRGAEARIVIRSASKGGRIRGASDLVLDLDSVVVGGKTYSIGTTAIARTGKPGIGANKRTAEYTGGGAAVGAIIGAIAGGGKGAAIGAGAGAGAGALTQIITKGGSIKVPVESILTFRLDQPLRITAQ